MREIRLYDALRGELAPLEAGDAIRIEVRIRAGSDTNQVDIRETRPYLLFSLLQRLIECSGLPAKFLFETPSGGERLYELSDHPTQQEDPAGRGGPDAPVSLVEVEDPEVTHWVDLRFDAGFPSSTSMQGARDDGLSYSEAMRVFGAPTVGTYLLGTHYSQPLPAPFEGLEAAGRNLVRIREGVARLRHEQPSPSDMRSYLDAFFDALAMDLDTPLAFVILFEWLLEAERRCWDVGDSDLRVMLHMLELDELIPPHVCINAGASLAGGCGEDGPATGSVRD